MNSKMLPSKIVVCEINASKRLLKRIKDEFSKLDICILGDSLYTAESIIDICKGYSWNYLFRFKEGRQKTLAQDYGYVINSGEYEKRKTCLEKKKAQRISISSDNAILPQEVVDGKSKF